MQDAGWELLARMREIPVRVAGSGAGQIEAHPHVDLARLAEAAPIDQPLEAQHRLIESIVVVFDDA